MAKKLVFDRSLSIKLKKDSSITVPAGEVWKVCARQCANDVDMFLYDGDFRSIDRIIGEGTVFKGLSSTLITGIAFKVSEQ